MVRHNQSARFEGLAHILGVTPDPAAIGAVVLTLCLGEGREVE